ncbi:hypothetical protein OJ253_2224 [Cryptosporidium canis]|uniref:Conserved oligomeric Golgi complex subunit 3 N-terminal domain-containing protein n=1 Tax=Cryptosporidium canis TaxID=195482 RepID=A0A9D5HX73_9CRYT|nr:hypothetical protein OJ253_2224 [Cryptosporidium canis]
MNSSIGIDGDPISPDKKPSTLSGNSISLIPEKSLQALRNISDICKGLTFISGIVVSEKQDSSGSICTKRTFCLDNFQHNIIEVDFVDGEFNKLESIKRSFNKIKSEWDEIKNKNKTQKKNLEKFESIKVDFIGNMAGFHSICDHSVSLLRDIESQAKIIEEYIFPYQQYTIMYYKLQNDKFSNNLKEVLNCFEIIDNSIVFFQNHPELKRTDYYVDGYKKLRIRLCNIVKNLMKSILDDCQIKRSIDVSDSISDTTPKFKSDCSLENKGEYNISLYFTQLRAKGKLFNEYVRLLLQRHKETSQNETYRSTIEDMESYYINFRISDECCGVKSFVRFGSKELYVGNSSQNCLTLNIKNLTRLALNYCKYEWITYNSFFSSSEPQSKNGNRINDIQRFSRELGNKARSSRGNSDEFNNFFSSLIELFGNEYYDQLIRLIRETHDPEILRESIQYLSQDILNITDDLYQSVSFPDIYLSSLLNYILRLQNSLIEQLMRCMETFIKEKIEDYELEIDELRYPEVLLSFNADKKLIRSLKNPDTLVFENIPQKCVQNNSTSSYVEDGLYRSSTPSECIDTEKSPNDEVEIITNVCFPPNKIRLETSSDIEDNSIDEEYLDSSNDGRLIRVNNLSNPYSDKYINFSINNAINISIGSYPVVKNALLALSYIEYVVPISTYLFLNKLIIQKCCDKLVSAKKFICSEIYFKDKISRIYHGNLFIIRNLLYLKYELVNLSKQHSQKNELEFLRDGMPKLDIHERDSSGSAKMPESNTLWVSSNVLYSKTTLESIVNIVDTLISSNLEELVNNICSNISLPLTKIVLQVHPEIQSSDISELQCTNHKYIKDSINLFWNNLEFHINSYILKYLNLYLSIAGKDEMEALFSTINIETASVETNPKNCSMPEIKNESNGLELSINNVDTCISDRFGCKSEKMHINSIIASILPSPISIFSSVKEVLVGVIFEFDHVLNKRTNLVGGFKMW